MNGATGYTTQNKFAYNFANLFKTDKKSCEGRVCTFTTTDGMDWRVTDGFASGNANSTSLVRVDINGAGKKPNSSTGSDADIYTFRVDASGAVTVFGNDDSATKARRILTDRSAKQ